MDDFRKPPPGRATEVQRSQQMAEFLALSNEKRAAERQTRQVAHPVLSDGRKAGQQHEQRGISAAARELGGTGRPAYHPATMLKIYVYGYVNQIQSSRRLERETARNVETMWLTGRLTPDFKTSPIFARTMAWRFAPLAGNSSRCVEA